MALSVTHVTHNDFSFIKQEGNGLKTGWKLAETSTVISLTHSQTTKLDTSKLKDSADDNSKFDENRGKFFKSVENTVGKGEIALYEQFLIFPHFFQKASTADT